MNEMGSEHTELTALLTVQENGAKFPLFSGHYNGLGVEVKNLNEISLLYQWSCFGKGSQSRSKPNILNRHQNKYPILRKRQFAKRQEWINKFSEAPKKTFAEKLVQKDIEALVKNIKESKEGNKDVIDLVSSDDEEMEDFSDCDKTQQSPHISTDNLAIVVPNSDSEGEDYFVNFQPKCCFNKAKLDETLILTFQEAYFLAYAFGCLQILDLDKNPLSLEDSWKLFIETEHDFVTKYIVYHYFRSKGYVVKPGIKFGGDFLLYKNGPGQGHADYIVVIKYDSEKNKKNSWLSVTGHIRMAGTTSKDILVAEVVSTDGCSAADEYTKLKDLCKYRVRETIWTRKIPCNNDDDEY